MKSLPGNPHAELLTAMLRDGALSHESLAILGLAHEQRTATLVNVVRMYADLGMAEHVTGIIESASSFDNQVWPWVE
ncbi:hypothetical protein [Brevibacterium sediminis]